MQQELSQLAGVYQLTLQAPCSPIVSAAIVLNEMRRLTEAARPVALSETVIATPVLTLEPTADCSRYDSLRSVSHVH